MDFEKAQAVLKKHAYYNSCSYEYAYNNYLHDSIKKDFTFKELMVNM